MNKSGFIMCAAIAVAAMCGACDNSMKIKHLPYPETFRTDVADNYFGTEVADPSRWLEDDNSAETAAWVAAENEVTFDYISQIPYRDAIRERLAELMDYPKESAPSKHGEWWYYYYNDGLQNQSVLYRTATPGQRGEVFLDPNTLSDDGTVALNSVSFSEDGNYCAYGISASGSDWVEVRVISAADGKPTGDVINWIKFSGVSWTPDSKGFYYSAYDAPKSNVYSARNSNQKVYLHKLGTPQSDDELIYTDPAHPMRYFGGWMSDDSRWVFIDISEGTSGAEILYRRAGERSFRTLFKGFDHDYSIIECKDDKAYVVTNEGAENYKLMVVDLTDPSKRSDLLPENEDNLLSGVTSAGGYLFAFYMQDAQSRVYQYDFDGRRVREVELPAIGSVGGFGGKDEDRELYYSFSNYTTPATIYKYDVATGESTLYKRPEVDFDPDRYTTEQVFYTSKDGTRVPMFVSYRKDLKRNGKNPCYLYAYGGFQISLTPGFSTTAVMFMEQGGVWCVANLRGGLEYGEKWHRGGMLKNKQNVFDDFIAAAEYLIDNKYTSSDKLAIAGGSNGGLLVGACEVQRPDLYAVCLPAVGVMDMLRYHKFTIGWGWAVEYGSSDSEEYFPYLYAYSPLHNIKEGVEYPATLVTTGDHDDRVVPAHSFKFAAQMQHAQAGDKPILIRIESNAGHGAGKPTAKRLDEAADEFAFLFWNTNTEYKR